MVSFWDNLKPRISGKKDLTSIGIANLVGNGLSAFFWFYIASIIDPAQYGNIHYFLGIAGMAQLISLIGTPNTITVYTAKNIKIQSTLFLISIIPGIISSIVIFLYFNRIDVSLLILGYIIFELVNAMLLGKKLFSKYSKFFILQKGLTLVLGIILFYIFDVDGIIFSLVLTYIPSVIIFINELRKQRIDFTLLKMRRGFLINNYMLSLSGAISGQIDKIIIAPILGFELLGNYSLALQFLTVLMMFSNIAFKYLLTQDSSGKENRSLRKLVILLSIGIAVFGVLVLPMIIPILFPKFVETINAIQIISLIVIPGTITLLYGSKLLSLEKSKYLVISKSISIIIIVSGFILLGPMYKIVGLASVLVLSSTIEAIFLIGVVRRIR